MAAILETLNRRPMEDGMHYRKLSFAFAIILFNALFSPAIFAQSVCEGGNGDLVYTQPTNNTKEEIIKAFAAKEEIFKAARTKYSYTQVISIQEMGRDGETVNGEFNQVADVSVDSNGSRVEKPTFAPNNTLKAIQITSADIADIKDRLPFVVTTEDLPLVFVNYVGRQSVDELQTYVFDISVKNPKKEKERFHGRIWVDDHDLMIVKTCGKTREDVNAGQNTKKHPSDLVPTFVTYREQVDGKYWFPTYCKANELLHFGRFGTDDVHIRETIKYSNYKLAAPQ
jgi:hypothetical protein